MQGVGSHVGTPRVCHQAFTFPLHPAHLTFLSVQLEKICSNIGFVYADAPRGSGEVENVARERFLEISGKRCAVAWPGRKGRELIFSNTHCMSHIVLGPFPYNKIIQIKIY